MHLGYWIFVSQTFRFHFGYACLSLENFTFFLLYFVLKNKGGEWANSDQEEAAYSPRRFSEGVSLMPTD